MCGGIDVYVELFDDGDMSHRGGRSGAIPMLLTWFNANDVARPELHDTDAPPLHSPTTGSDDQRLA